MPAKGISLGRKGVGGGVGGKPLLGGIREESESRVGESECGYGQWRKQEDFRNAGDDAVL
jgi:hypothetical protein